MKHLIPFRIYESQMTSGVTEGQKEFLNKYTLGTWSVNPSTGLVDVQGNFNCSNRRLKSLLGISFGHVSGDFRCGYNQLTSLEGSPQTVDGVFECVKNELKSLKGSPQTVGLHFRCFDNQLTSLEGAPVTVGGTFYCDNNQLTSLEGAPQTLLKGGFYCSRNELTSLKGAPKMMAGSFICNLNELTSLEGAPLVGGIFSTDELNFREGEWNMEGWAKVLNTGTEEAKKLILTLPWLQPDWWNSRLKEKPQETTLLIVTLWDDLPKETQDGIQIPSNWKDSFDNLLDLQRAGIF